MLKLSFIISGLSYVLYLLTIHISSVNFLVFYLLFISIFLFPLDLVLKNTILCSSNIIPLLFLF